MGTQERQKDLPCKTSLSFSGTDVEVLVGALLWQQVGCTGQNAHMPLLTFS